MDIQRIQTLIERLTKDLTPTLVCVELIEEDQLLIRVVSDSFKNIAPVFRYEQLSKRFNNSEVLAGKYTLIFQAFTKQEWSENSGSSQHSQSLSKGSSTLMH